MTPDPLALLHLARSSGSISAIDLAPIQAAFPEWAVESVIGQGATGLVIRVRCPRRQRRFALKLIPIAHARPASLPISERPALPGVVRVHDHGERGPWAWTLMDWVDGISLRHLLDLPACPGAAALPGPIPLPEALRLAADLATAVAALHRRGEIHGDLAPANILVDAEGAITLVDVGHHARAGAGPATATAGYAAPELLQAGRLPNAPADVFALGAVIHELRHGHPPIGYAGAPADPGLPAAVHALLRRCLAPKPATRPSAEAVAEALRRVLDQPAATQRRGLAARLLGILGTWVRIPVVDLAMTAASVAAALAASWLLAAQPPLVLAIAAVPWSIGLASLLLPGRMPAWWRWTGIGSAGCAAAVLAASDGSAPASAVAAGPALILLCLWAALRPQADAPPTFRQWQAGALALAIAAVGLTGLIVRWDLDQHLRTAAAMRSAWTDRPGSDSISITAVPMMTLDLPTFRARLRMLRALGPDQRPWQEELRAVEQAAIAAAALCATAPRSASAAQARLQALASLAGPLSESTGSFPSQAHTWSAPTPARLLAAFRPDRKPAWAWVEDPRIADATLRRLRTLLLGDPDPRQAGSRAEVEAVIAAGWFSRAQAQALLDGIRDPGWRSRCAAALDERVVDDAPAPGRGGGLAGRAGGAGSDGP